MLSILIGRNRRPKEEKEPPVCPGCGRVILSYEATITRNRQLYHRSCWKKAERQQQAQIE